MVSHIAIATKETALLGVGTSMRRRRGSHLVLVDEPTLVTETPDGRQPGQRLTCTTEWLSVMLLQVVTPPGPGRGQNTEVRVNRGARGRVEPPDLAGGVPEHLSDSVERPEHRDDEDADHREDGSHLIIQTYSMRTLENLESNT